MFQRVNFDREQGSVRVDGVIDGLLRRHALQTSAVCVAVVWPTLDDLVTQTEKPGWSVHRTPVDHATKCS